MGWFVIDVVNDSLTKILKKDKYISKHDVVRKPLIYINDIEQFYENYKKYGVTKESIIPLGRYYKERNIIRKDIEHFCESYLLDILGRDTVVKIIKAKGVEEKIVKRLKKLEEYQLDTCLVEYSKVAEEEITKYLGGI